jgi:predicted  nucleic acid-binding Zn-ribbon protein
MTERAATPRCRTCGQFYRDGADGYDGECPTCADKTFAAEAPENLGAMVATAAPTADSDDIFRAAMACDARAQPLARA